MLYKALQTFFTHFRSILDKGSISYSYPIYSDAVRKAVKHFIHGEVIILISSEDLISCLSLKQDISFISFFDKESLSLLILSPPPAPQHNVY